MACLGICLGIRRIGLRFRRSSFGNSLTVNYFFIVLHFTRCCGSHNNGLYGAFALRNCGYNALFVHSCDFFIAGLIADLVTNSVFGVHGCVNFPGFAADFQIQRLGDIHTSNTVLNGNIARSGQFIVIFHTDGDYRITHINCRDRAVFIDRCNQFIAGRPFKNIVLGSFVDFLDISFVLCFVGDCELVGIALIQSLFRIESQFRDFRTAASHKTYCKCSHHTDGQCLFQFHGVLPFRTARLLKPGSVLIFKHGDSAYRCAKAPSPMLFVLRR